MTYRCEDFDNDLLDLLYDELPKERADVAKRHISACSSCAALYERYQLTRRMAAVSVAPEPLNAFTSILDEAKDRCEAVLESVPSVAKKSESMGYDRFWAFIRGAIRKPVLASALVAATVLLVTVFLVERLGPSSKTDSDIMNLLEKAPLGPVVEPPTATAEVETKSNRAQPRMAPPLETTPMPKVQAEHMGNRGANVPRKASSARSKREADEPMADDARAKRRATVRSQRQNDELDDSRAEKEEGLTASPAKRMQSPKVSAGKSSESEKLGEDAYQEGMAAYQRGDCKTAYPAFQKVVRNPGMYPGKRAPAMHHLARCEKHQGRCSNAMTWYDNLISDHPAYAGMPSALWEASQCCRRLGREGRARELLEMLSTIPGWEDRARRQLDKM